MTQTINAILKNHDASQRRREEGTVRFHEPSRLADTSEGWRSRRHVTFHKILVPVDFTTSTLKAFEYARALATPFGSTVCLLHVVERVNLITDVDVLLWRSAEEVSHWVCADMNLLARRYLGPSVPVEIQGVAGRIGLEILRAARATGSDLIILTTRGLHVWRHLFRRSTAKWLMGAAPCPVLLLQCAKPVALEFEPDADPREEVNCDEGVPEGLRTGLAGAARACVNSIPNTP